MKTIADARQEVLDKFETAQQAAIEFNNALTSLRSIKSPEIDEENEEDVRTLFEMGRDIDMRTAYLLRGILTQHGNVLFA